MRGSLHDAAFFVPTAGSIPACAGQPGRGASKVKPLQVYPRVCGAAWLFDCGPVPSLGLSPRVRGSLDGERTEVRQ